MVDKSNYPCKRCRHKQSDHSKRFPHCFACEDNHKSSWCHFERIANLEFLEWLVKQKEKI